MSNLKFKKGYFLSSKGQYAHVVNMIDENNELLRFTGTSKALVEDIYSSTTSEALLTKLRALHPDKETAALESFLSQFLSDISKLEFLDKT